MESPTKEETSQGNCPFQHLDAYEAGFVLCVVLALLNGQKIIKFFTNLVKSLLPKPKRSPEVLRLQNEVKMGEAELSQISPTAQFATYFKKERVLNKLKDELQKAISIEQASVSLSTSQKVDLAVPAVAQMIAFYLLSQVADVQAFCLDANPIWPFNHLLNFPGVWLSGNCPVEGTTPVSLFFFFWCITNVVKRIYYLF